MTNTAQLALTDFLLARIAEDEAVARAAMADDGLIRASKNADRAARGRAADAAHIARHDPARVLAECAAKRAIIEAHQGQVEDDDPYAWIVASEVLLDALASVYADHPDYQQSSTSPPE